MKENKPTFFENVIFFKNNIKINVIKVIMNECPKKVLEN